MPILPMPGLNASETQRRMQELISNRTELAKERAKKMFMDECFKMPIPSATVILQYMDPLSISLHVVLIIMATVTVGLFLEEVYFLRTHIMSTYRRRLTLVQLGIPPLFTVTSVMGCFFPSGHVMIDFVTSVYFGIALHCLLVLKVNYYGGLKQFLKCFQTRKVLIRTGPLCCCLFCLPEIAMTRKNFRVLWYGTFQSALIRPLTLFVQGVFDSDGSVSIPGYLYTVVLAISMMTGMWALVIFRKASNDFIGSYRISGKFFVFQMVLLVANVQPGIIHSAYYSCFPPFSFATRQIILNYQITTIEFFILALFSRCFYRRSSDNDQVNLPIANSMDELKPTASDLQQLVASNGSDGNISVTVVKQHENGDGSQV